MSKCSTICYLDVLEVISPLMSTLGLRDVAIRNVLFYIYSVSQTLNIATVTWNIVADFIRFCWKRKLFIERQENKKWHSGWSLKSLQSVHMICIISPHTTFLFTWITGNIYCKCSLPHIIRLTTTLQVSTRKPVGFMQSCCFVFVGILSTYK